MTSRELHAWVESKGVPAKWQLPVAQLLRGLLEEEREWPQIPYMTCLGPIVLRSFVALWWRDMTVNLFDDGAVRMWVRPDSGPGAQRIPLGADWVREVVRLAPKKRPASESTGHYGSNEKPAPEVVGGYRQPTDTVVLKDESVAIIRFGAGGEFGMVRPAWARGFHDALSEVHPSWRSLFVDAGARIDARVQRHNIRVTCDLSKLGVEQAIIDLHEFGDKPVLLVVSEIDASDWSWIYENRDYLAHHGIDTAKCYRSSKLGRDEWILRGEKHEIYSEGA